MGSLPRTTRPHSASGRKFQRGNRDHRRGRIRLKKANHHPLSDTVSEYEQSPRSRERSLNSGICKTQGSANFCKEQDCNNFYLSFINLQLIGFGQKMNAMYLAGGVLSILVVGAVDVLY